MNTQPTETGTRGFLAHEVAAGDTAPFPVTPNNVTDKHHSQVQANESGIPLTAEGT